MEVEGAPSGLIFLLLSLFSSCTPKKNMILFFSFLDFPLEEGSGFSGGPVTLTSVMYCTIPMYRVVRTGDYVAYLSCWLRTHF